MKRFISVFLKGAWIGGTLTVPGVSGGSMAMILGLYEQLITSFNNLLKRGAPKKESVRFLLFFCAGAGAGILALSGLVVWLLKLFPTPMAFFFAGAVAGGIPVILRELNRGAIKWYNIFYLLAGILLIILISFLPTGLFSIRPEDGVRGWLMQIAGGIIAAAALVLPGISVSHMLYVLGLYTGIMEHVSAFDLLPLIPFVIGVALGVILMTRAVEYLLVHFKLQTYLVILGFVLGSVGELLSDVRISEISVICIFLLAAGFAGIFFLFRLEQNKTKS